MAEDILRRVLKLTELLSYQEGSVVSRTLIDAKAGTVTLFAFDQGQGLSEHTAPYDAMVCVLDGETRITIAGEASDVKAGDMIIMPANEPHSVYGTERFKMLLIMVRG
jgi:quercetin dioxygenase-like cupin family protein